MNPHPFLLFLIALFGGVSLGVELAAAVVFALRGAWWVTLASICVALGTVAIGRIEWRAWRERREWDERLRQASRRAACLTGPAVVEFTPETERAILEKIRAARRGQKGRAA